MKALKNRKVPRHIAIIMDGNGRWAKSKGLQRTFGHIEGVKRVEEIINFVRTTDIEVLTLFAFSLENWSRPKTEVSILMKLFKKSLNKNLKKFKEGNIKFQTIGSSDMASESVLDVINKVKKETENNTGLILNLAFNYGARREIIDAVKAIFKFVLDGQLKFEDICEETISRSLYTKDLPDPDLFIRTSGEKRISNFLLWQLSYTELYFTDKHWPDFGIDEIKKAIDSYCNRERRYGGLKSSG